MPEKLNLKRNNLFFANNESPPGIAIAKIFKAVDHRFFVFARKVTTKFAVKKKLN